MTTAISHHSRNGRCVQLWNCHDPFLSRQKNEHIDFVIVAEYKNTTVYICWQCSNRKCNNPFVFWPYQFHNAHCV